jgi:hypothetical protein
MLSWIAWLLDSSFVHISWGVWGRAEHSHTAIKITKVMNGPNSKEGEKGIPFLLSLAWR